MMISAPASARRSAVALPIPWLLPVTSATFPANDVDCSAIVKKLLHVFDVFALLPGHAGEKSMRSRLLIVWISGFVSGMAGPARPVVTAAFLYIVLFLRAC